MFFVIILLNGGRGKMDNKEIEWLSEEEQYEMLIDYGKIIKINGPELREIRLDFFSEVS